MRSFALSLVALASAALAAPIVAPRDVSLVRRASCAWPSCPASLTTVDLRAGLRLNLDAAAWATVDVPRTCSNFAAAVKTGDAIAVGLVQTTLLDLRVRLAAAVKLVDVVTVGLCNVRALPCLGQLAS
jgi:hypothetical protein